MRLRPTLRTRPAKAEVGPAAHRLLIVEPGSFLTALAREIPHDGAMVLCQYHRLSCAMIGRVMPDCVVAPLFSPAFDIFELIALLQASEFQGKLMAVSPPLPNCRMVLRELQSAARRMTVRIIEHDGVTLRWTPPQL